MSHLDKCTKGEWVAEYDGDYETSILVRGEENFCLASVHGCNVEEINSAHLMAASKKMYAALEDVMWFLENNHYQHSLDIDREEMKSLLVPVSNALSAARGEK